MCINYYTLLFQKIQNKLKIKYSTRKRFLYIYRIVKKNLSPKNLEFDNFKSKKHRNFVKFWKNLDLVQKLP